MKEVYSKDWVTKKIPLWSSVLDKFKGKPVSYLEIGCFEGKATRWILDNFSVDSIFIFDTFHMPNMRDIFENNIRKYIDKVLIFEGKSQEEVRKALNKEDKIDIAYIDGSHMAYDVLEDAILVFRHMKIGGIIIFDDYGWHKRRSQNNPQSAPKLGIDSFLNVFKDFIEVHHVGWQVIIEKVKE